MIGADDLYPASVLDHGKRPRNTALPDPCTHSAERSNPLCGDRVRLALCIAGERVLEIGHDARGCLLCVASASMLTEAARGRSVGELLELATRFEAQLRAQEGDLRPSDALGALVAFAPVARDAMRRQCAALPWNALRAALAPRHGADGSAGAGSAGGGAARGPFSAGEDAADSGTRTAEVEAWSEPRVRR
jgi:nitrogen fixation NifU-like protein